MRDPKIYRHYGQTSRKRVTRNGEDHAGVGFDPQTRFALGYGYRFMGEWLEGFQQEC